MDVSEAVTMRRTIRQFQQKDVPYEVLEQCINAARLAPSASNLQPLEYVVVDSEGPLEEMFKCMGFGGDVESFGGKEPRAYIVVLLNREISSSHYRHDSGMAVENIVLAAWEKGIGSCILARIDRDKIREILKIPDKYEIDLVVALGYPAERAVAEDMEGNNVTGYYRDEKGVLHVPKRRLEDILHRNKF